jgi:hypothetical protein
MTEDISGLLVENFLKNSWGCCITPTVEKLANWKEDGNRKSVSFFKFDEHRRVESTFEGKHFFLRSSVEYSNPQLTVEEVQGIVAARLLEVCGNYFHEQGLHEPDKDDYAELHERLRKPPQGLIVAFLLNTDDIEADRYSMNPLKQSIVTSGQSAFPAANVKTGSLKIDPEFVRKYEGKLISKKETDLITAYLAESNGSYVDFSDSVKYNQLKTLSDVFGIDLSLPSLRMPLATLQTETKSGMLHHIISETHKDFEAVKQAYECMGRSITKRTTLMTVPHSQRGYGSKRAARGKIHFNENKLENVTVTYKTTRLYPNAIDPNDIAVAEADDKFTVAGEKLADYSFVETPSSPQFFLYSLGSPENAALWHGVGAFAAPQLLQSYASVRVACREGGMVKDLEAYGVQTELPMQLNLMPSTMWGHPIYRNIDASIGCVDNITDMVRLGVRIEHLPKYS